MNISVVCICRRAIEKPAPCIVVIAFSQVTKCVRKPHRPVVVQWPQGIDGGLDSLWIDGTGMTRAWRQ